MESTLMIIGVNYRTAPVEVRERFWISESRRYEALVRLARSEAIEEVSVLATCSRTEFVLWTRDASMAGNSVLNFLTAEYGLRLCEWKHFYRLIGEAALLHLFKVASSLDSVLIGEAESLAAVKEAWALAQKVGTTGRFLDAAFQKAIHVADRVRTETALGQCAVSVPYAAVELARQLFGSLQDRKVVLLGAGQMGELSAEYLMKYGAKDVRVVNRTLDKAQEIAQRLNGTAAQYEQRWQHYIEADIIVSATACPHIIFTREEGEYVRQERHGRPLLLIDIAVPRDIDPKVRSIHSLFLYDIDDLENVVRRTSTIHETAAEQANTIVTSEAKFFVRRLLSEVSVPTVVALRERLDEICRQEVEAYGQDAGPFSNEQEVLLNALAKRIGSRIAGTLARELKDLPEQLDQEKLTAAVQKLFHLKQHPTATAN
ncbi:MAG: glutamyl-tRNA reductase [Terriglobales bacterium]